MPKSKFQEVVFTGMMVAVMVYAMICYNISWSIGGMTNQVFLMALNELIIMGPVAFVLEMFAFEKPARFLAFRIARPDDRPIFIILAISSATVCLMCPAMSFVATLLFLHPHNDFIAIWIQTTVKNFPMALLWQIFFAGPLVRLIFRTMFKKSLQAASGDNERSERE